tara:strand:- start:22244 stop:23182 length:939 start_codon:yes stop_codon:yes gene_type:complete
MKAMRLIKRQTGGYMSALEQTRPDLFKTISNYRSRLTAPEQQTFDQRANIQYKASLNMPEQMRKSYYDSIDKQFAEPNDQQFRTVQESLKSKTFVPTYQYYDPSKTQTRHTGYYRDLSKEIEEAEKAMKNLTITEKQTKTRTPYTLERGSSGAGLAGYRPPPPSTPVYELPSDYSKEFRTAGTGAFGQGAGRTAYGKPGQNTGAYGTYNPSDYYVKGSPETYTVNVNRAQRAGDPEYDRQFAALERLKTRHSYRNMPSPNQLQSTTNAQNVYQKLGMAKSGGLKEDIQKIKSKGFSVGGKAAIRGTKFKGVF